jgi:crotonobetainyl-CoA:carnitine CoA-transferase CaiB-like acyl-CoA transferase
VGNFPALRVPFKLEGFDDPAVQRPPLLGEHTEHVLTERLGLSRECIAALKEAKAI